MKSAVNTILAEKDISLEKESKRFWSEITNHKYNFKRQEQQLDALDKITKSEF
jgi:secreted Zn-dependent insulinase-like peptidase